MKYVLLEVNGEYPALEQTEEYEDWDDVVDNNGTDGLVPIGEPSQTWHGPDWDGSKPITRELAQPPCLLVKLNRRDPRGGEAFYELVGIIVPKDAIGSIKSLDEIALSD